MLTLGSVLAASVVLGAAEAVSGTTMAQQSNDEASSRRSEA